MREIIEVAAHDAQPTEQDVFTGQGIPADRRPSATTTQLFVETKKVFSACAQCVGVIADITIPAFETLYAGEGMNEAATPLDAVFRKADNLAVFAVTVGGAVSRKIDHFFKTHEYALAGMLDAFASSGAERVADRVQDNYRKRLIHENIATAKTMVLRYSPGYCGWHVSGQKKLFAYLKPEEIGITLLDSFLMKPLKSISGVFVAGPKDIHIFEDNFPVCSECQTHSCRSRIQGILQKQE
ncbi:hypothetical protein AMJ87_12460 [candidate division WOR_3 bacterium SM23_60]|uniref:AdoMet activation domain-containing protein n=1 Tax=candidate division WOR_3 bacterium SM23_60 TaxID=1703780 RepID=A0A0S8G5A2_UNCW3|nr:MAG: hypothetical protein AMJ87_12460 [candidate division WOR_3 bacterium SM23_60]